MTARSRVIMAMLLLLVVSMITGCQSLKQTQEVRVAVPIVCQATEPQRPVMPTNSLTPDSSLDQFVQAATAEIERREGYEVELVTALRSCTKPLNDTL